LGLAGVGAGPVVRLEGEAVQMRADVDLGTGIGVVPPRAPDPERRLIDRERGDPGLEQLDAGRDAAEAGPDDDDPRPPTRTEQLWGGRLHAHMLTAILTSESSFVDRGFGGRVMSEFETVNFFKDRSIHDDPYPYFEWLRAQNPVWQEPRYGA